MDRVRRGGYGSSRDTLRTTWSRLRVATVHTIANTHPVAGQGGEKPRSPPTTVSVSSSPSADRRAPSGLASAGLGRRLAASAIDWFLCGVLLLVAVIVAAPIDAGARDYFGNVTNDVLWKVARSVLAVPILLYFGLFLRTGHTLGMRALDFHVRVASTGSAPGLARSAVRACLAVLFAAAAFVAWFGHFTKPPAPEDVYRNYWWQPAHATVVTAEWIAAVAVLGKLWSWVDRSGRSLWDHLFGLAFVERAEPSEDERAFDAWLGRQEEREYGAPRKGRG
jgi:RDD family